MDPVWKQTSLSNWFMKKANTVEDQSGNAGTSDQNIQPDRADAASDTEHCPPVLDDQTNRLPLQVGKAAAGGEMEQISVMLVYSQHLARMTGYGY